MQVNVHFNAENDLDRFFEQGEEGEAAVGYLDNVINILNTNPFLAEDILNDKYHREYSPPGPLGLQCKPILSLQKQGIKVIRIRFDDGEVSDYRMIYAPIFKKQPNGSYHREIYILAVINKKLDNFNYQPEHPITTRIIKDYEELHSN